MALKEVRYKNSQKLDCEGCLPAQVIIAVPNVLVADSYADLPGFINAQLTKAVSVPDGRIYTFEYDDIQLSTSEELKGSDILGVMCDNILIAWLRQELRKIEDGGDD